MQQHELYGCRQRTGLTASASEGTVTVGTGGRTAGSQDCARVAHSGGAGSSSAVRARSRELGRTTERIEDRRFAGSWSGMSGVLHPMHGLSMLEYRVSRLALTQVELGTD